MGYPAGLERSCQGLVVIYYYYHIFGRVFGEGITDTIFFGAWGVLPMLVFFFSFVSTTAKLSPSLLPSALPTWASTSPSFRPSARAPRIALGSVDYPLNYWLKRTLQPWEMWDICPPSPLPPCLHRGFHHRGGDRSAWLAWFARLVTKELWRSGQRVTQLERSPTQYLALGRGNDANTVTHTYDHINTLMTLICELYEHEKFMNNDNEIVLLARRLSSAVRYCKC